MTSFVQIWPWLLNTVTGLKSVKTGLRIFLLSLFIYGQAAAISHAHEHHDDMPHSVCEVCIVTINDEDGVSNELDIPDVLDRPDIADAYNIPASLQGVSANVLDIVSYDALIPLVPELCLKATRAPPLH